jgi:hypothetical protein
MPTGTGINGLLDKATGWVDTGISFFSLYTTKYSKLIVYGALILCLAKIFKFKFNVNTGGKK